MPISDWTDLMPHLVDHAEYAGRADYGAVSYGSPVSYTARVTYKNQRVRIADGSEVVARGTVWIAGTPSIDPEDQITLPDDSTPPILSVEKYADEDGDLFVKVFFG